jgi:hypothetical protein
MMSLLKPSIRLLRGTQEISHTCCGNAYTYCQSANGLHGEDSIRALQEALKIFDRTLEVDPEYGKAWSGKDIRRLFRPLIMPVL